MTGQNLTSLKQQLAEAKKDAERYRWIANNWNYAHGIISIDGVFDLGFATTLDEAIDQAMRGEEE